MSHDFQMARGHDGDGYNLAVGEPFFIQDALDFIKLADGKGEFTYPHTGGQPELLEELRKIYPYKHIIVANGAKHALLAGMYAYREHLACGKVYHAAPYWPSYPTLAKLSNMQFVTEDRFDVCRIVTSPNNPDSSELNEKCDIWDAVYAHPVYGFTKPPEHQTAVFSASKVLGMSGARVGWIGTDNDDIGRLASYYVEVTTSGVNTFGQRQVAEVLRFVRNNPLVAQDAYARAREELDKNIGDFLRYISPYCVDFRGAPAESRGMFAWFQVFNDVKFKKALQETKIKLVTGEACGATEPGWYRMNMGMGNAKFRTAVKLLDFTLDSMR